MISKAFPSTFEPNQSIFKDGDPNYTYFIVERGIVEVLKNEKVVAQIKAGEGFGDESLIYGLKSGISARSCGEEVALWAIDYLGFYEGIKDVTSKFYQENIAFLDTVFILSRHQNSIYH